MTQKPPEMPPVIWAYMDPENDGGGFNVDESDGIPDSPWINGRYILAAPKEDVEEALKALDRVYICQDPIKDYRPTKDYETIRRVLLANAGRKE